MARSLKCGLVLLWSASAMCLGAVASQPVDRPASYVRPIDLNALRTRMRSLPPQEQELLKLYFEAARRTVLEPSDGVFPIGGEPAERIRNLAERAKGAAVLSALAEDWPAELRERCRTESKAFVKEIALAHRAKANFGNAWQAAFWTAEAGIAGWFLWDELEPDVRDALAELVSYQADRFIGVKPKMGFRGDTQAETVAWNSTIVTLAVNMMPKHPHNAGWDEAAKRLINNTMAVRQDATSDAAADDGLRVRDWVVGANLYDDFTLENHNQFHIDYVLTTYRFHAEGAPLYWLAGRKLPMAFRHHARDLYEKALLPCMTADGFFEYVSDNDWKRYHCWTESCSVDAYMASLEGMELAAGLERRALNNATALWRAFPKGFSYDNPYVCGKPWTSRIADAVLLHILRPSAPKPLADAEIMRQVEGVHRLENADLLSHLAADGSYASSCRGRAGNRIYYAAPARDAFMLLPVAGNFQAFRKGKPLIAPEVNPAWKSGADFFWTLRRDRKDRGEVFVSLPDGTVLYASIATASSAVGVPLEHRIWIEKPHCSFDVWFADGQAAWKPGQTDWQRSDGHSGAVVSGNWLNLNDRMGYVVVAAEPGRPVDIVLPKAGARSPLQIREPAPAEGVARNLVIVALPNADHKQTAKAAATVRFTQQDRLFVCHINDTDVKIDVTEPPAAVSVFKGNKQLF